MSNNRRRLIEGLNNQEDINIDDYLTVEALVNNCVVKINSNYTGHKYCIDGKGGWKTLPSAGVTINSGQTVSIKSDRRDGSFVLEKKCNLKGNCMSLLYGDDAKNYTSVGYNAFNALFQGCTGIVNVSEDFLPATTLSTQCYDSMFYGCTALKKAPLLPATTLASRCYYNMFYGCSSLEKAPELPAKTLVSFCYDHMFYNCIKLKQIKAMFTTKPTSSYTDDWVYLVDSYGVFYKNYQASWKVSSIDGVPFTWNVRSIYTVSSKYLAVLAGEDGLTVSLSANDCEYKIDNGPWISLPAGTATQPINAWQKLEFRGVLTPNSSSGIGTFTINKKCAVGGNCMAMLFGDNAGEQTSLIGYNYAFYNLFKKCTKLIYVDPDFLPATTLSTHCYDSMFYGCTALKNSPDLPATSLGTYCYSAMFRGCSKLIYAPELPATNLADYCYYTMFYGCSSLEEFYALPARTMKPSCYRGMFTNCTSLVGMRQYIGDMNPTLYRAILYGNTLASYCYHSMFKGCTSLPGAVLHNFSVTETGCCQEMFYGCSSLMEIAAAFTSWDKAASTDWVYGVSGGGVFYANQDAQGIFWYGDDAIPSGWEIVYE